METFIYCIENNKVFYDFLGEVVKNIMKEAIDKGAKSNMSCIFICLSNLYTQYTYRDVRNINRTLDVIMQVESNQFYNDFINKKFYTETVRKPVANAPQNNKPVVKKKGFTCCGLFG
jgi:hypothetical protein